MPSPRTDANLEAAGHGQHVGRPAALALGALGVVFGDIGTSPLYSLQECLSGAHGLPPVRLNVLGSLSLVFWSLVLVICVKYVGFLMKAHNRGEGGIMALLALLPEKTVRAPAGRIGWVGILVIAGAALLYGDGMITPAISVLSAVEGLGVATHALQPYVVPLTCVILFGLFLFQSRGTGHIGRIFGPVMLIWFVTIGLLGLRHILSRPDVLVAVLPTHAYGFFLENGFEGFRLLGSVILVVTGGEALYADMGHFGKHAISRAWFYVAFPALLLSYFGQGALILDQPHLAERAFYSQVPNGWPLYALTALATLATIIASQALISGAFSLTYQAIRLGYFPRVIVQHTSSEVQGQIYIPLINWGLMLSCIGLVVWFGETSRLASAYGLAVAGTMTITSIIYFWVTHKTWHWAPWRSVGVLALFLSFDLAFLGANVLKFFHGGYLPVLVGLGFFTIMAIWRVGRGLLGQYFVKHSPPLDTFLDNLDQYARHRIPGMAVFMASNPAVAPPVLIRMVNRFQVLPERVILLTVTSEPVPSVPSSKRTEVAELGKGFYMVLLRYGFMEMPNVPWALRTVIREIEPSRKMSEIMYLLGHETFVETRSGRMPYITQEIFSFLSRNARNATHYFRLPPEQVVEVGAHVDL